MRKIIKLTTLIAGMLLFFIACQEEKINNELKPNEDISSINPDEIARSVIDLMQETETREALVQFLTVNKFGSSLENIVNEVNQGNQDAKAISELRNFVQQSEQLNKKAEETGIVEIPELWMFAPNKTFKSTSVLVSFAPKGDECEWENIKAYDLNGNIVYLDPLVEPEFPVIIVELNGMESLKMKVEYMNKELKAYGLQTKGSAKVQSLKAASGLETSKIEKIRLKDDKEPWIKGAAEIYAITSGVRGTSNNKEAEIAIVAMPYLDHKDKDYYPNQIVLFWDDYAYQAANIQLYEQDSNYNYKDLVGIIVAGVFEITGILTAEPWVSALGKIASAIINAMPDDWYTDDDDYVDSYYTIMKNTPTIMEQEPMQK